MGQVGLPVPPAFPPNRQTAVPDFALAGHPDTAARISDFHRGPGPPRRDLLDGAADHQVGNLVIRQTEDLFQNVFVVLAEQRRPAYLTDSP